GPDVLVSTSRDAMPDPTISLIICTYNHERYVSEALASVVAQTTRDFEVLIFDDASSDATVDGIRSWLPQAPVPTELIVNQQNLGLCATRTLALSRCRGEFVCSLSGDDVYEPTKLERELELFRSCGAQVGAVFSDMVVIDDDGVFERRWFDGRTH